jgi:polysaccharide biosynthesis/export protein
VLAARPDLDIVLESGDTVYMPKRPSFVLALGDVNNPSALQYVQSKDAAGYLREAGGPLATADRSRIFVVLPDGTAQPLRRGGWSGSNKTALPPGSTIIVPKNIDPLYTLDLIKDVTTILAQIATAIGTVAILAAR